VKGSAGEVTSTGPPATAMHAGHGLVIAWGEFDILTVPVLRVALHEAIQAYCSGIVIDLEGVTFIDASAIRVIAEASLCAQQSRLGFSIRGAGGVVAELLRLTGLLPNEGSRPRKRRLPW
jgi:anti-anti-sigma factor